MKQNKFLVYSFLFLIYGVFIFYIFKQVLVFLNISPINTTDNWQIYEYKKENNIIDKLDNRFNHLKVAIENRANNYFPFYIPLNELYQNINYQTNKLFYHNIPLKINSDQEYLFYNKDHDFYYYETFYTDDELEERLNKQVNFFNNLAKQDIELYLYLPTRYEITNLKDYNLNHYLYSFIDKLDSNINVSYLQINSISEYLNYFYKTDHHWNMHGALQGYKDIMQLLKENPLPNLEVWENKKQKYYGSLAKTAMLDQTYDYISDVNYKGEYTVLVNDKEAPKEFKPRKIALNKTNKYYDYYVSYYNGQYGKVVYHYFHNENKDNLLIMSDSFAWSIDYLIASSFNNTHVINLRYDEFKNNTFNLTKYIKDNHITKVLFLYESGSTMFDQYNYNFTGRVY